MLIPSSWTNTHYMFATELHCVENLLHKEKEIGRPHKKRPLHSNLLPDSGHFLQVKGPHKPTKFEHKKGGEGGGKRCMGSARQEI
jgi:hypothetical protein